MERPKNTLEYTIGRAKVHDAKARGDMINSIGVERDLRLM